MIGRFLGTDVPATGFSIGFERVLELIDLGTEKGADAVAILYDDTVPPARLVALKTELIGQGRRVRLERKPRNLKPLFEQLAASGYHRVATACGGTLTAADLDFRELA